MIYLVIFVSFPLQLAPYLQRKKEILVKSQTLSLGFFLFLAAPFASSLAYSQGNGPIFPSFIEPSLDFRTDLELRIVRYEDILPVGGQLMCYQGRSKTVAHQVNRTTETDVVITFLENSQTNPNRKPKFAKLVRSSPVQDYIQMEDRFGDVGYSFEMVLEKRLDPNTGAYPGALMLTEARYSKDANGNEERKLFPISMQSISCFL